WALRFMGSAERKFEKPECISPEIERQWVRAPQSRGSNPAWGKFSCRYSPMASVSQILRPLWVRQGTKKDGDSSKSSARVEGSSWDSSSSSNSSPAIRHNSQPRSDQEE